MTKLPALDLTAIDQVIADIAAKAGRPRHCCEISFGRLSASDELLISIVVHLGKLPGIGGGRVKQTATGCGTTLEEAIEDVLATIEGWGLLSEQEVARRRARRAAKPPALGEVPDNLRAAYAVVLGRDEAQKLRDLRGDELLAYATERSKGADIPNGGIYDYIDLSVFLRQRDGAVPQRGTT